MELLQVDQTDKVNKLLKSDCDLVSQIFIEQLNNETARSCIMLVNKELQLYGLNTVTEAVDLAHTHLLSKYKDATQYVIAWDGGWV